MSGCVINDCAWSAFGPNGGGWSLKLVPVGSRVVLDLPWVDLTCSPRGDARQDHPEHLAGGPRAVLDLVAPSERRDHSGLVRAVLVLLPPTYPTCRSDFGALPLRSLGEGGRSQDESRAR